MSVKALTLPEIQKIEFDILCKFEKFCVENDLTYMLCGGTLLGAVRHEGFIPWDDDIDVLMPRPDYDRLLHEGDLNYQALGSSIEMWHWRNGKLKYPFIKFIDNRTSVIGKYIRNSVDVGKIWIDIFPLDGNPDGVKENRKIYRKAHVLRRLLMVKLAKMGEGKTIVRKICKPVAIMLLKPISVTWLCKKMDDLSKSCAYESAKYAGGILWGYGPQERMEKSRYEQLTKLKFETETFSAPLAYDEYLTNLYGDYWKLPPVKERGEQHSYQAYIE